MSALAVIVLWALLVIGVPAAAWFAAGLYIERHVTGRERR